MPLLGSKMDSVVDAVSDVAGTTESKRVSLDSESSVRIEGRGESSLSALPLVSSNRAVRVYVETGSDVLARTKIRDSAPYKQQAAAFQDVMADACEKQSALLTPFDQFIEDFLGAMNERDRER